MNKPQALIQTILIIFSVAASLIKFTPFIIGQHLNFSLADTYAPVLGVPAVIIVSVSSLFLHHVFNLASILHIFPVIFGAWYFASRKKLVNVVPLVAIIGFIIHPVGRQVWYYSLFWLVHVIASFYKDRSALANALGATFTAHAVGGLLWIYAFNPPASVWNSLIPIVIMERAIFTVSTAAVYVMVQKIINYSNAIPAHQNPSV